MKEIIYSGYWRGYKVNHWNNGDVSFEENDPETGQWIPVYDPYGTVKLSYEVWEGKNT